MHLSSSIASVQPAGHTASTKGGPQVAKVAPVKAKTTKKATPAKAATKGKKSAKVQESDAPREGSKTAQVVEMLQRKNGASITEIMSAMGWQRHTMRGFVAGAMKKAAYQVESFKPEGGERTYRLSKLHHRPSRPARLRPPRAFLPVGRFPSVGGGHSASRCALREGGPNVARSWQPGAR